MKSRKHFVTLILSLTIISIIILITGCRKSSDEGPTEANTSRSDEKPVESKEISSDSFELCVKCGQLKGSELCCKPGQVRWSKDQIEVVLDCYRYPKQQLAMEETCRRFNEAQVRWRDGRLLHIRVAQPP